jgi:hypothetical protein
MTGLPGIGARHPQQFVGSASATERYQAIGFGYSGDQLVGHRVKDLRVQGRTVVGMPGSIVDVRGIGQETRGGANLLPSHLLIRDD